MSPRQRRRESKSRPRRRPKGRRRYRGRRTSRRRPSAADRARGRRRAAGEGSKVRRRAAFRLAAGDEGGQRLEAFDLDRRRDEIAKAVGGDALGRVYRRRGPALPPSLIVAPVRDGWREKGGAIARLGVLSAKEMPTRADLAHRLKR